MLTVALLNGIIFAQNISKSSAIIKVSLINGASIGIVNQELEINQLSKVVNPQLRRNNSQGILLHFAGNNVNNMIISYKYSDFSRTTIENNNSFKNLESSSYTFNDMKSADFYFWISDPSNNSFSSECTISLVYN